MSAKPSESNWVQRGKACLWCYESGSSRAYRGWHLTLDGEAAESTADLLKRIRASDAVRKRTLSTIKPTPEVLAVPNNRRAKALSPGALKLIYDPAANPDRWRIELRQDTLELEMGSRSLDRLINGVTAVRAGEGDFSIGDPPLWFWWYPRGRRQSKL
jgi:hypothetical protein